MSERGDVMIEYKNDNGNLLQLSDLAKRIFNFPLVDLRVQVTNVHFALTSHSAIRPLHQKSTVSDEDLAVLSKDSFTFLAKRKTVK